MSNRYSRTQPDPLALVAIDESLLDAAVSEARASPRRRSIVRFHEHDEAVQRMLNAIEPESYTRPHRHLNPPKPEAFVALRGSGLVIRFGENGAPVEGVLVSADGPARAVEIPPGAWHCLVSLRPGSVFYEVIEGPYDPGTHKEFAPWAPPEEDADAGRAFIAEMRRYFEPLFPALSAIDQIEAEEDEIC
jgi:cupin fold WbuC family metalloprotein